MSDPDAADAAALAAALVDEGLRRSAVLWLELPGGPRIAWYAYADGAALVVHDGAEQTLPGLGGLPQVVVLLRSKDSGGLLVRFDAAVVRVEPGTPEWTAAARRLEAARQSPRAGAAADLWVTGSLISRLVPAG